MGKKAVTLVDPAGVPTLMRANSNKRILNQRPLNTPTKTLRMKSLLWVKPTLSPEQLSASIWAQIVPTLLVNIAALSSGLSLGYSAIAMPQLKPYMDDSNNGADEGHAHHTYRPFTVDEEGGSWIASIFGIGAIFGGFAAAAIGGRIGRRKALMVLAGPDILGWILIASAQNLAMMLTGRFLCGFAVAGYSPTLQVFIAEIAQPHHRGWMNGLTVPILALGSLTAYVLGSVISWHWVAVIASAMPILLCIGLVFVSDTPYWYIVNGQERKALEVMLKFRDTEANALAELLAIADAMAKESAGDDSLDLKGQIGLVSKRQYRRPFILLNLLFLLMTFSGKYAISFYAVDIFHAAAAHPMNEYYSAIVIGFIQLIGAVLFIPAVKMFSRRILLCVSALVMGVSLSVLGLAMYSHAHHADHVMMTSSDSNSSLDAVMVGMNVDWLPLLCVITFMIADPLGLGSIPFLYTGEFFPSYLRSLLSGVTIGVANLEMFILLKSFPTMNSAMGHHGTFWFYAAVCFVTIFYVLLFIPETKGKSLQEIETAFGHKESLHVTPYATPIHSPAPVKKLSYAEQSLQFTL